jgi:ABC-2 type transport system ATP-binding protein
VEACGLETEYKKQIQELSKGFRQRTGLAQALIHDPEILILDEPTSGLDPLQIIGIRELIKSLAHQKTIIFSTHVLQEVSPVTDRVVIINEGRLIADGMISDLAEKAMESNRLFAGIRHDAGEVESALRDLPGLAEAVRIDGGPADAARFELRGAFDSDLTRAVARLVKERGWELCELHEARYSLEDTFIALTRQSAAGSRPSPVRRGVA